MPKSISVQDNYDYVLISAQVYLLLKQQSMNDLRLLQQVDPNKKVISLQFKQISSLDSMMPLLIKFQDMQSLSLHGNRLKNLPKDMSSLACLTQLDISNNLFIDLTDLMQSLKTLPALTHLIMNFKSQQQENFVKNSLPNLERINKKPVTTHKSDYTFTQKKKNQINRLNQGDLQSIGILYDQIRQIYRSSKYFVDKQLAEDFDRNVQNIMSELAHKIKGNQSQVEKNCNILCGKYALIDLCFVKLITYFYHFDKKIASTFEKIHDQQADMFKSIIDIALGQALRSKIQISQVRTQKQELYKAEIKRLKIYQTQSNRQIDYLQNKNNQLLQKLMKYGKSNMLQNTVSGIIGSPSKSPTKFSNYRQQLLFKQNRQNNQVVTIRKKPKALTLNQLKQIMFQIYESKQRFNASCLENKQPLETMENHMYTYLNQKYGLKSLAVEWAMNIVNGIKKFGAQDPEVATFGKILRNQVQQEFMSQIHKIKENFVENYKRFKKNLTQGAEGSEITINESQQILLFSHLKRQQISLIIGRLKDDKMVNNLISVQKLERGLLQYYVRKHDQKIFELYRQFKDVDDDQDGIIDVSQLQTMMKNVNPNVDIEQLVQLLDPSKKGIIVFFYLCEVFLRQPDFKQYFKITE